MSFPAYENTKDSGIEWLGDLPSHWQVQKFRHLFDEMPRRSIPRWSARCFPFPAIGASRLRNMTMIVADA